jgi:hypothetical protein
MPGFLREGGVAAAIGALLGSNAPATRLQSQSLNLPINGLIPVAHTNDVYICATMDCESFHESTEHGQLSSP